MPREWGDIYTWDVCVGMMICMAAGAVYSYLDFNPWQLDPLRIHYFREMTLWDYCSIFL